MLWNLVDRVGARMWPVAPKSSARLRYAAAAHVGEPEIHLVGAMCDPARISIDVGANWGLYTSELLRHSRGVVAFEPNPDVAACLCRSFPSAIVHACALGAENATAALNVPLFANGSQITGYGSLNGSGGEAIAVPIRTLDSFSLEGVGFIKIDVEGHEMAVLDGGWQTILRERPNMMIEATGETPPHLVARLADIGYDCRFHHEGAVLPFADWHPGLRAWHGEAPGNFLFRHHTDCTP